MQECRFRLSDEFLLLTSTSTSSQLQQQQHLAPTISKALEAIFCGQHQEEEELEEEEEEDDFHIFFGSSFRLNQDPELEPERLRSRNFLLLKKFFLLRSEKKFDNLLLEELGAGLWLSSTDVEPALKKDFGDYTLRKRVN